MLQTLFHIPNNIPNNPSGIPVFGFGLLFYAWAFASAVFLVWLVRRQGFNAETRSYVPVLLLMGGAIAFLLPLLADQEGLPIRGYGTMVLIGVVAGIALAAKRAKRAGVDPDIVYSLAFWLFLSGMAGARLFYVIEYWDRFAKPTSTRWETIVAATNVAQGGLVVYGAFLGALPAFLIFTRLRKLPLLPWFDLIAPSMVLGLAIGRIGCFMNGCCYGGACSLPWAVTFPQESPVFHRQVENAQIAIHGVRFGDPKEASKRKQAAQDSAKDPAVVTEVVPGSVAERAGLKSGDVLVMVGSLTADEIRAGDAKFPPKNLASIKNASEAEFALIGIFGEGTRIYFQTNDSQQLKSADLTGPVERTKPVHPAQLYAAIDALLLFLFLLAYEPYKRQDGELLAMMLTIQPISRFLIEVIRNDEAAVFGTDLSISQNLSILLLIAGLSLWAYLRVWRAPAPLNFYAAASH